MSFFFSFTLYFNPKDMKWLQLFPLAGLLAFIILLTWRILLLKKRGISPVSSPKKPGIKKILLYILFLLIFLSWLFELTRPFFSPSFSIFCKELITPFTNSLLLQILGMLFILGAVITLYLTLIHFKSSLRFGLDKSKLGTLITTGIFSISRNPFFLSILLYFSGVALIIPNGFFIAFAIIAIISIHLFILKEEKFMSEHYGENYQKYKQKVRRYL